MKSTFGVIFRTVLQKKYSIKLFDLTYLNFLFLLIPVFLFLRIFQITFWSLLIKLCEFTTDILESIIFVTMSFLPNI